MSDAKSKIEQMSTKPKGRPSMNAKLDSVAPREGLAPNQVPTAKKKANSPKPTQQVNNELDAAQYKQLRTMLLAEGVSVREFWSNLLGEAIKSNSETFKTGLG